MCLHEFVWLVAEESTRFDLGHFMCNLHSVLNTWLQIDFAPHWCFWFSANDSFIEQVCPPLIYTVTAYKTTTAPQKLRKPKTTRIIKLWKLRLTNRKLTYRERGLPKLMRCESWRNISFSVHWLRENFDNFSDFLSGIKPPIRSAGLKSYCKDFSKIPVMFYDLCLTLLSFSFCLSVVDNINVLLVNTA